MQKDTAVTVAKERNTKIFEAEKVTTYERAAKVIRDNMIQFNMASGEFIINSDRLNGVSYVVKLRPSSFLSVACSCPGTAMCHHIIAAQMMSNCSEHPSKRAANSTIMRKNPKKTADKRSGCKQPRAKDVDKADKKFKKDSNSAKDPDPADEKLHFKHSLAKGDKAFIKTNAVDNEATLVEQDNF